MTPNPAATTDEPHSVRTQALLCLALFAAAYTAQTVSPVMLFYTIDLRLSTTDLTLFFTVYAAGLMLAFLIGGPDRIVTAARPSSCPRRACSCWPCWP